MQDLRLLVVHRNGAKRIRRLHRREADELHDVVGDHVTHRANIIEIAAASLDTHGFGIGDLHMIDEALVPDRLEDAVAEAEDQQVLHRLFAEVVIDAVNLILRKHALNLRIQRRA